MSAESATDRAGQAAARAAELADLRGRLWRGQRLTERDIREAHDALQHARDRDRAAHQAAATAPTAAADQHDAAATAHQILGDEHRRQAERHWAAARGDRRAATDPTRN